MEGRNNSWLLNATDLKHLQHKQHIILLNYGLQNNKSIQRMLMWLGNCFKEKVGIELGYMRYTKHRDILLRVNKGRSDEEHAV